MQFENTVLNGLLKVIPRGQFARLVVAHGSDRRVRQLPSWSQLVALLASQLGGCRSLRELEALLASQPGSHYHLGIGRVCRSTLAVANAKRPAELFEALFGCLAERLAERLPRGIGRDAVRLINSTGIRLGTTAFRWARFSADYGGVKLRLLGACPPAAAKADRGDPAAALPTYFAITPNKINGLPSGRQSRTGGTSRRPRGCRWSPARPPGPASRARGQALCDGPRLL